MRENALVLDNIKSGIEQNKERILRLHESKTNSSQVLLEWTRVIDLLLQDLYSEIGDADQVALVAQGGYGRSELCFQSDIDLLLLYEGKPNDSIRLLSEKMTQTLWDAGLQVGLATRTVGECQKLMSQDLTILTSLIDSRFLAGDVLLAEKLREMQKRFFSSKKNRKKFFEMKISENREREEKYGDSIYLLEPNLKEGKGGLRDYHTLHWFSKVKGDLKVSEGLREAGYLTPEEFDQYWQALSFLWTVRNELHRRAGRRMDQILFDHQEPLAHWSGYENDEHFLGVELFMQRYYSQAALIHQLTEKALKRLEGHSQDTQSSLFTRRRELDDPHVSLREGRLILHSSQLFWEQPLYLLKIFDLKRRYQASLDDPLRDAIEKNVGLIDDDFRKNPETTRLFREMLGQPGGLGNILSEMNDLGVLGAFLPEFKKLHFRAQHDVYHLYTVDVHSLFAVGELGKLMQGEYASSHPTVTQVVQDIEKKDVLAFAILYHDIGKGEGKGHVEKGAPLIRCAGERLGFSAADVDALEFLERSHLIMTHIAFRRDLEDQNLIIQFAKSMQEPGFLNMLYVLTFCDVKAVSQEAMTDWKSSLMEYLYLKTREVLQKGTFTKEKVSSLVAKVREEVMGLLSSEEDQRKVFVFFQMMPPRYLLATPPSTIVHHIQLWEKFEKDPIVFESRILNRESLNEVVLFTWQSPTLFSQMTGVFASYGINILEAQMTLSSKGQALQVFKVTDAEGKIIDDAEKWLRVTKDIREVLEGRVPVEKLVEEKFRPQLLKKKVARVLPSKVEIDNDISAYYTVITIYTQDRMGLLYQITSTLASLGLYVDVSKISTKVDQVADTFYVKDIFGHKITSVERLKKIEQFLRKVLEEEPTPGWKPQP